MPQMQCSTHFIVIIYILVSSSSDCEILFYFILFYFCFLGLHPWHMKVPRLAVASEVQPLAHGTAATTWDPSHICDLHQSSQQHWILNPLSEARDQICNFMVPGRIRLCCAMMGMPQNAISFTSCTYFDYTAHTY